LNGQKKSRRRSRSSVAEQDTRPQSATPRDPEEDRLVTRLLHAAEAVAEPLRCPADIAQRTAPTHATPKHVAPQRPNGPSRPNGQGDPHAPEDDYVWLRPEIAEKLGITHAALCSRESRTCESNAPARPSVNLATLPCFYRDLRVQ